MLLSNTNDNRNIVHQCFTNDWVMFKVTILHYKVKLGCFNLGWIMVWNYPRCRIDRSTCWPAVQHATTTVLRLPPTDVTQYITIIILQAVMIIHSRLYWFHCCKKSSGHWYWVMKTDNNRGNYYHNVCGFSSWKHLNYNSISSLQSLKYSGLFFNLNTVVSYYDSWIMKWMLF